MGIYDTWRGRGLFWFISATGGIGFGLYGWIKNDGIAWRISSIFMIVYFGVRAGCSTIDAIRERRAKKNILG
jgi:hypothetical protein